MDKLKLIEEANDTVVTLRRRVENAKASLDAEKKALDAAIKRRDTIIVIGEKALEEQQPLFAGNGDAKANGAGKKEKKLTKKEAAQAAIDAATDWRTLAVKDAITLGAVVNGLEALSPSIVTLGGLVDWFNDGHSLHELPGVGDEKFTKAMDQWEAFWKSHPGFER